MDDEGAPAVRGHMAAGRVPVALRRARAHAVLARHAQRDEVDGHRVDVWEVVCDIENPADDVSGMLRAA